MSLDGPQRHVGVARIKNDDDDTSEDDVSALQLSVVSALHAHALPKSAVPDFVRQITAATSINELRRVEQSIAKLAEETAAEEQQARADGDADNYVIDASVCWHRTWPGVIVWIPFLLTIFVLSSAFISPLFIAANRYAPIVLQKDAVTAARCNWIVAEAEAFAAANGGWTRRERGQHQHEGRRQHSVQLSVRSVRSVNKWLRRLEPRVSLSAAVHFDVAYEDVDDVDAFVVKYVADNDDDHIGGDGGGDDGDDVVGDETHSSTDDADISARLSLSGGGEFSGGGTRFQRLGDCEQGDNCTVDTPQGSLLMYEGNLAHSDDAVTAGVRYLLVVLLRVRVPPMPPARANNDDDDDDVDDVSAHEAPPPPILYSARAVLRWAIDASYILARNFGRYAWTVTFRVVGPPRTPNSLGWYDRPLSLNGE
jgi:hypothetical protein